MARFKFLLLAFLCTAGIGLAHAVINVPADQPTIQAGIDAAANGEIVLVAPGTYVEHIDFHGKAVVVTSSGGAAVTVIDGGGSGVVVNFDSGETNASQLNGFTIQNGSGSSGGGIAINFSAPVIRNNRIINNFAAIGGGMYVGGLPNSGFAKIVHNVFTGNTASEFGGAITFFAAGGPLFENNLVHGNNGGAEGGAIWVVNEADEIIVQNVMYGDIASSGTEIYSLVPQSTTGFRLINNTIVSTNVNADAAVVADGFNTNAEIINNLIVAPGSESALICNPIYTDGPPVVQFNDAFSATGTSYGGMCTGFSGTNGNISANPEFASRSNFQLQTGSPAIDHGTNSAPNLPTTDFANKTRIVGGRIDMGAFEHQ